MFDKSNVDFAFIGSICQTFPDGKLPSTCDVLKVFLYHHRTLRKTIKESAKITARLLISSWTEQSSKPLIQDYNIIKKIEVLFDEWSKAKRIRPTKSLRQEELENAFIKKLTNTFNIAKSDCSLQTPTLPSTILAKKPTAPAPGVDNEVDKVFTIRSAKLQGIIKTKEQFVTGVLSNNSCPLESDSDEDYTEGPPEKKTKKDLLTPEVTLSCDAVGLSSKGAAKIVQKVAQELGANVSDCNISKSNIHRRRQQNRKERAGQIKESFSPDAQLTLHWDGKHVRELVGNNYVERLAVVVTGVSTDKILEIPIVSQGTGKIIAETVYKIVSDWRIRDNVKAFSFDTTSANTGTSSGACKRLEELFGRDMLHLACRHHVLELTLESVWATHLGPSNGPDLALCKRFQQTWTTIDKTNFSTAASEDKVNNVIGENIDEIISFAKQQIQTKQPRADYLELLDLTIIFLGGVPPKGIKFQTPGGVSRARWMARAIYALKIWIFRAQFTLTRREETGLLFVCMFVVGIYIRFWYQATDPIGSPKNDLDFVHSLLTWKSVDLAGSVAALAKMGRHTWYLKENLIALSLFDNRVPSDVKIQCVENMQTSTVPHSIQKGNGKSVKFHGQERLSDFFTTRSMNFFNMLDLPTSFIGTDPTTWEENLDYRKAREVAAALSVVNDPAERAIGLMNGINRTITKTETDFQHLIQVRSENKDY